MKTTEKKANRLATLTCSLLLISQLSEAQTNSKILNGIINELSKDGFVGFYIFFGVAGFALMAYLVSYFIRKYGEKNENEHNNIRPISRKPHHHHRVIKKSA
jgi:hypothetical protein